MNRILLAFRAFFALLFSGSLSEALISDLGLMKRGATPSRPAPASTPATSTKPVASAKDAAPPPPPARHAEDGALQLLGILQHEGRVLDFFMEDITSYSDDQVGGAVRELHEKTQAALVRHFGPVPVIDAVEGTPVAASDPAAAKARYIGNVPATGKPIGGLLRHKGWKASAVAMPSANPRDDLTLLAPPEIEVE